MATYVTPYCAVNGHDFSSIIYTEGIDPSGGSAGVEEVQMPGRNYADVRDKGRAAKKYKIKVVSMDRDVIEEFLKEVNTAPEDSEFYPFDAQRFGLIASAFATATTKRWIDNTSVRVMYEAEAEITCREAWLCGADLGLAYATDVAVPAVSGALTNVGQERTPISLLQAAGDYISSTYIANLSIRITPGTGTTQLDRKIILCEKMLRDDMFEFGWRRREAVHSWEADLTKTWANVSLDVHSKVSGGSITGGILTIDNGDYLMIPFHGPLPVSGSNGAACLEIDVTEITGDVSTCQVALLTDVSDKAAVDHDALVVGSNTVYIPDMEGIGHVAIGIKAGAAGAIKISGIKGTVKRYVAPSQIPWADPGEAFKIRVEATAGTQLASLKVDYNDRYWY